MVCGLRVLQFGLRPAYHALLQSLLPSVSLNSNGIIEVTPFKKRSREQQQNSLNTEASSIVCNDKKKLVKLSGRDSDFHGCDMFSECPTVTPDKKRNRDDLDMEQS